MDESADICEGPVQVITVSPDGDKFTLHEKRLEFVLRQVPQDMKVASISVVGTFRTGKSFLLDLMLRYLRYYDENPGAIEGALTSGSWLGSPDEPLEGNENLGKAPEYSRIPESSKSAVEAHRHNQEAADGVSDAQPPAPASAPAQRVPASEKRSGFKWRSGRERMTTGIWLWSRPYIRTLPARDGAPSEKVAVILMDTQGMFDSETTQMLTACIFGLSTLISSYVVYNLPNRIQEDYLQNLALFSEYGRRVLEEQERSKRENEAAAQAEDEASGDDATQQKRTHVRDIAGDIRSINGNSSRRSTRSGTATRGSVSHPPFQRIELLVRDADIEADMDDRDALREEMESYLSTVLSKTHHEDLKTVRDHIRTCFEEIGCFLLPHPGLEVREKGYDGSTRVLRPSFLKGLNLFMHTVFCEHLVPKRIHGRDVTASQLKHYITAYAGLFQDRAIFPEARVLLEATADANNRSALDVAFDRFCAEMEVWWRRGYAKDVEVCRHADLCEQAAVGLFDGMANFGPEASIATYRSQLRERITARRKEYLDRNKERDPWRNLEIIIFSLAVALVAWVLQKLVDFFCWADVCRTGSQALGFLYGFILMTLLVILAVTGRGAFTRIKAIAEAVHAVASTTAAVTAAIPDTSASSAPRGDAPADAGRSGLRHRKTRRDD